MLWPPFDYLNRFFVCNFSARWSFVSFVIILYQFSNLLASSAPYIFLKACFYSHLINDQFIFRARFSFDEYLEWGAHTSDFSNHQRCVCVCVGMYFSLASWQAHRYAFIEFLPQLIYSFALYINVHFIYNSNSSRSKYFVSLYICISCMYAVRVFLLANIFRIEYTCVPCIAL